MDSDDEFYQQLSQKYQKNESKKQLVPYRPLVRHVDEKIFTVTSTIQSSYVNLNVKSCTHQSDFSALCSFQQELELANSLFSDSQSSLTDFDTFDMLSLDSGINSSFSNCSTLALTSPIAVHNSTFDDSSSNPVVPDPMYVYDSLLVDILTSKSGDEMISNGLKFGAALPLILKDAFVFWSKSSLDRLKRQVIKIFLLKKPLSIASNSVPVTSVPQQQTHKLVKLFDRVNRFQLIRNFNAQLDDYRCNLVDKFYAFHSLNFS